MKIHMRFLTLVSMLLGCAGCATQKPAQRPLELTSYEPTYTCSSHVWHQEWSETNACMSCAQEVQTCVRGRGFTFCQDDCNACLGKEICAVPSNIDFAVESNEAAKNRPGQIRALIRADVGFAPDSFAEPTSNGLVIIGLQIFDENGPLWAMPQIEDCRRSQVTEDLIFRLCDGRIEAFDVATGFRFPDLIVTQKFEYYTTFDVDPTRKTYLLELQGHARIYDAAGKQFASHENVDAIARAGDTWSEQAVLKSGQIAFFRDGIRTGSEQAQFQDGGSLWVNGTFISKSTTSEATIFDAVSRKWFTATGRLRFQGRTVIEVNDDDTEVRQVFPQQKEWKATGELPPVADRYNGWLSNSKPGNYLFATAFTPGTMMGSATFILPHVKVEGSEFRSTATRHGNIIWAAAIENEDAIWLASGDGLVKRWSFATGKGVRADIPFEFAVGGGHATADGGLVLMSRSWNPVESQFAAGQRIMIWHPDHEAKILSFPDSDILDAALVDKNTIVVVGRKATFWWDLAQEKVVHTELGTGHLSENGKSIGFFDSSTLIDKKSGPARFFRTNRHGKTTKFDSVQSCAFSPNGDKFACAIPKRKPYEFIRRLVSIDDGKVLEELSMTGLWVLGRLSPDGDAELEGRPLPVLIWTSNGSHMVGGESDFALGFSYGGRLIKVIGDSISLEDYDIPKFELNQPD
jgi:hypothetical protein